MEKRISIVIPVYNGELTLKECLDSVFNLCYENFEVIVINDCSSDGTLGAVNNYKCKVISFSENKGAGAARDRGVKEAQGEIVVFLDADCVVPKDWLGKINNRITPDVIGVSGRYVFPEGINALSKIFLTVWDPNNILYKNAGKIIFCLGGNCAFWKNVLLKARAKKELLYFKQLANGEDTVMCAELNGYGALLYDPGIRVVHNKTLSFSSILKKSIRAGYTGVLVSKLCGRLLLKEPYRVYKLAVYLGTMFLFFLFLGIFPARPAILALSVVLYVTMQVPIMAEAYKQLGMRFSLVFFPLAAFIVNMLYSVGQIKSFLSLLSNITKNAVWLVRLVANMLNPQAISKLFLFITSKCNANCKFCFNKEQEEIYRRGEDLSLGEISKIVKGLGFLPFLTITGGEPFLREDLHEICSLFYSHCETKFITIVTNGIRSSYTVDFTEKLLTDYSDINLTVLVALDGIGERHDFIKGVKNCYLQSEMTLNKLSELRLRFSNLTLGINTIVSDDNADSIKDSLGYFASTFNYDRQSLNLIREPARTSNESRLITIEGYLSAIKTSNKNLIKHVFPLKQKINEAFLEYCCERVLKEFKMRKSLYTCVGARKMLVMNNNGDIFPCELLLEPLGNIRDQGYEFIKIARGERARDLRKEIRDTRCYCQWPCAAVCNILFNSKSYFGLLKKIFLKSFKKTGHNSLCSAINYPGGHQVITGPFVNSG